MTGAGSRAFAHVRARALRGRLLGPASVDRLRSVRDPKALAAALAESGLGDRLDRAFAVGFGQLVADLTTLVTASPHGRDLLLAMARLHEVENLKLLRRAVRRGLPPAEWARLWRPLGSLTALPLERFADVHTPAGLAAAARGTPYEDIAAADAEVPGDDPAAELRIDLWASQQIVREAMRLPNRDAEARALSMRRVRERDLDALRRAAAFGLSPELGAAVTAVIAGELGAVGCAAIVSWRPEDGPLGALLPKHLLHSRERIADWPALGAALARDRREACRLAFLGPPFGLAPIVAVFLLRDEQWRGLVSVAETAGEPGWEDVLDRRLEAGAMGG